MRARVSSTIRCRVAVRARSIFTFSAREERPSEFTTAYRISGASQESSSNALRKRRCSASSAYSIRTGRPGFAAVVVMSPATTESSKHSGRSAAWYSQGDAVMATFSLVCAAHLGQGARTTQDRRRRRRTIPRCLGDVWSLVNRVYYYRTKSLISLARHTGTNRCFRRDKAALSSGYKSHPATAPAGSNRSSYGGDEIAEAFGKRVTKYGDSASV